MEVPPETAPTTGGGSGILRCLAGAGAKNTERLSLHGVDSGRTGHDRRERRPPAHGPAGPGPRPGLGPGGSYASFTGTPNTSLSGPPQAGAHRRAEAVLRRHQELLVQRTGVPQVRLAMAPTIGAVWSDARNAIASAMSAGVDGSPNPDSEPAILCSGPRAGV